MSANAREYLVLIKPLPQRLHHRCLKRLLQADLETVLGLVDWLLIYLFELLRGKGIVKVTEILAELRSEREHPDSWLVDCVVVIDLIDTFYQHLLL